MNELERKNLITTILKQEELRPLSRFERLKREPLKTLPYYLLAALSHAKPFKIKFKTLWGTKMSCYLPEGNTFYYYGYCESNLTNFFIRYIQAGMTVVDVGAHVGIYSMLSAKLVGGSGHVYSFEPTPWTFNILKENTEKLPNVSVLNNAISETRGTLTFADYGPGYGAYNSAHAEGAADLNKEAEKISVLSVSLDDFCQEKSLTPDFIKIDAEGFEYEVLKGSVGILKNKDNARPLISIEVAGGEVWTQNRRQSFDFLALHDYFPYEISADGLITPHILKDNYTYDNLLFVPEERIDELKKFYV